MNRSRGHVKYLLAILLFSGCKPSSLLSSSEDASQYELDHSRAESLASAYQSQNISTSADPTVRYQGVLTALVNSDMMAVKDQHDWLGAYSTDPYQFSEWAKQNPSKLPSAHLGQVKVAAAAAPRGSIVVLYPGICNADARRGDVFVVTDTNRASSCQVDAASTGAAVFVPIK